MHRNGGQSGVSLWTVLAVRSGGCTKDNALLIIGTRVIRMPTRYTEDDARLIVGKLLDAVSYMHIQNVTHRDLKLENLVLARTGDLASVTP